MLGSWRSRAGASTSRTTFAGKTHMFWITFFAGLVKGPPVDAQAWLFVHHGPCPKMLSWWLTCCSPLGPRKKISAHYYRGFARICGPRLFCFDENSTFNGNGRPHTQTHTHANTHRHTDTHTQTHTDTHRHTDTHTHTDRHTHTQTHTDTHTDTQTHTQTMELYMDLIINGCSAGPPPGRLLVTVDFVCI